jgi:hypothetical protein
MDNIQVLFNIWDIVEHSFNEKKFKIVWYEYIPPTLRYICLQSDSTEFSYMKECELKHNTKRNIWFILNK